MPALVSARTKSCWLMSMNDVLAIAQRVFGAVKERPVESTICARCGDDESVYAVYVVDYGWLCGDCYHGFEAAISGWRGPLGAKRQRKTKEAAPQLQLSLL